MTMLQAGDYACSLACCGFERKETDLNDLQRVMMQVSEVDQFYANSYLIVNVDMNEFVNGKGSKGYSSRMAFWGSLIGPRNHPPIFVSDYTQMLDLMYQVITKNHDNKPRGRGEFNHVRHVTKKDVAMNVLTSFPGIGTKMAERIIEAFGSVANFVTAGRDEWLSVEGIGIKTCVHIEEVLYGEV